MEIREQYAAEAGAITEVITAAFADGGQVARLWSDVAARGLSRASLVAVDGGAVVGHVGVSHCWLDCRKALVDALMLSPLAVCPPRQGQGIGTALCAAALDASRKLGSPVLYLEGSPAYYGRRGFSPGSDSGIEPASRRSPAPAVQVARLAGHEPWMTGRIVYHDVWWEHDAAGLRDPDLTAIEQALAVPAEPDRSS